jgi:hypothetical protein
MLLRTELLRDCSIVVGPALCNNCYVSPLSLSFVCHSHVDVITELQCLHIPQLVSVEWVICSRLRVRSALFKQRTGGLVVRG